MAGKITHVLPVVLSAGIFCAGAGAPARPAATASPPGFTMERTGGVHDFDYFEGAWNTVQRRLRKNGSGSPEWEEFPGVLCMTRYLAGAATVDELYFPTKGAAGLTLRLFDPASRQWSIYWASSASGRLDPVPVVGGFQKNRGEFYAQDRIEGRPAKVRYLWLIKDRDHARWEQAISFDDSAWETNWTADFTRGDAASLCERGQPKR